MAPLVNADTNSLVSNGKAACRVDSHLALPHI